MLTSTELSLLESDGLLNVENLADDSPSYLADCLARRHPATFDDVNDFHALTERYYKKIVNRYYPRTEAC